MKKVLIMNDMIYGGGVEKVMKDIVKYLQKKEYNITILTPDFDHEFYNFYDKSVNYIYINKNLSNKYTILVRIHNKIKRIINCMRVVKLIKINNYDIAISIKEGPCMSFVSNLNIPRKLAWIHVDYNIMYWTKDIFKDGEELKCMKKFDKVVCVSSAVKDSVTKNVGDPGNLCVRYNPIDDIDILKDSSDEIIDIHPTTNKPIFISVGRLTEQKGYNRLLSVCNELNKQGYSYELWIIGEGNEESDLKDFAKINNMINVKFLGLKHNPYKYMKLADWFICSSISESFGIALQESIVLGVPIITTYCPGVCELINEDIHGIIVDNSEEGILFGMKKALSDLQLLTYYKNKIRLYLSNTSFEKRLTEIEDLL